VTPLFTSVYSIHLLGDSCNERSFKHTSLIVLHLTPDLMPRPAHSHHAVSCCVMLCRRAAEEMLSAFTDSRPTTAPPSARPWEGSAMAYATRCDEVRTCKATM
jgi:hypothetical protein